MNYSKFHSINLKIFISSFISLIIIEIIPHLSFLPFTTLTGGTCSPLEFCDTISAYYILIPLITISLVSGIIFLFNKRAGRKKILFFIFIILILIILLMSFNNIGGRCKLYISVRQADLRQIQTMQEMYYLDHGKYAENYEELFSTYTGITEIIDPETKERYTDADGYGFDGGDNDPNTWSVHVWIEKQLYKFCIKTSPGFWFKCDQSGCYEE